MNRKQFALLSGLICAMIGAIVGYATSTGNVVLPFIALMIGIALLLFAKRNVNEVLEDERIIKISEKASRRAFQIFVILAALVGTTLITLKKYVEVGYTLAFSTCFLVTLYLILYAYYNRKALK